MPEHPQYTMWKARHDAELAAERERAAKRAERDALGAEWQQAWRSYETHWRDGLVRGPFKWPAWRDLRGWLQLLLGRDRHR